MVVPAQGPGFRPGAGVEERDVFWHVIRRGAFQSLDGVQAIAKATAAWVELWLRPRQPLRLLPRVAALLVAARVLLALLVLLLVLLVAFFPEKARRLLGPRRPPALPELAPSSRGLRLRGRGVGHDRTACSRLRAHEGPECVLLLLRRRPRRVQAPLRLQARDGRVIWPPWVQPAVEVGPLVGVHAGVFVGVLVALVPLVLMVLRDAGLRPHGALTGRRVDLLRLLLARHHLGIATPPLCIADLGLLRSLRHGDRWLHLPERAPEAPRGSEVRGRGAGGAGARGVRDRGSCGRRRIEARGFGRGGLRSGDRPGRGEARRPLVVLCGRAPRLGRRRHRCVIVAFADGLQGHGALQRGALLP
mmetsp:Transcript_56824/g.146256  ORF Transcript_56824/g.146256 Transcript_56824/m.146256 type:complete len:360 (-) Transcript_56824:89-1168(-)